MISELSPELERVDISMWAKQIHEMKICELGFKIKKMEADLLYKEVEILRSKLEILTKNKKN
jgi:hypothetical protein